MAGMFIPERFCRSMSPSRTVALPKQFPPTNLSSVRMLTAETTTELFPCGMRTAQGIQDAVFIMSGCAVTYNYNAAMVVRVDEPASGVRCQLPVYVLLIIRYDRVPSTMRALLAFRIPKESSQLASDIEATAFGKRRISAFKEIYEYGRCS